jgi:predicted RNase H-related nuclease YkuK (DUF458 family)
MLSFCLSFPVVYGQNDFLNGSSIQIIKDNRIDSLVNRYMYYSESNPTLEGYRIQIFFDAGNTSLQNAYKVMEAFENKYPEENAYVSFKEPYYRVRVGDFRSRIEAEGFRQKIMPDYPNAFVIKDNIDPPPIR